MAIGKTAMILLCFMIAAVAMVSIFAIAYKDKSTDAYYADTNNTINGTIKMTEGVASSVTGTNIALVLVVAVMFFASVIAIYKKK